MAKLTQKQQWFRRNLLGKIHQSERYLAYYKDNEDVYRQMLSDSFKKRSAADLTINQLITLLDFLNGKTKTCFDGCTKNQAHYIRHTWVKVSREKNIPALIRFIKSNTGLEVVNVEALSKQQASGVLAALNKMKALSVTVKENKKEHLRVLP